MNKKLVIGLLVGGVLLAAALWYFGYKKGALAVLIADPVTPP